MELYQTQTPDQMLYSYKGPAVYEYMTSHTTTAVT